MASASNEAKPVLKSLTRALRVLHKALVDATRKDYEKEYGEVPDAGHLLQLLTKHPQFDWLHQLSEFMVDVDELLDQDEVTVADLESILLCTKSLLLSASEGETSLFLQNYRALLAQHPEVVMAHAEIRQLLKPNDPAK